MKRELRWYKTEEGTALQERITVKEYDVEFIEQDWTDVPLVVECKHEWIDVTNEHITDGEMCILCRAVRPGPKTTDIRAHESY